MSEETTDQTQETQDTQVTEETTETTTPLFSYAEGVAGTGEAPEWFKSGKYATVSAQAEAYTALEGKFGSFSGAPEEYTVNISDELKEKGVEIAADDPVLEKAMEVLKARGMDQEGFDDVVNLYLMGQAAQREATDQVNDEAYQAELTSLGQNAQGRIDDLKKWASANLSTDMIEGFNESMVSAASVKVWEHVVSKTRGLPINPNGVAAPGGITEAELHEMQFAKDEHGNRKIQTDKTHRAEYERKKKLFYGDGEHVQVIG